MKPSLWYSSSPLIRLTIPLSVPDAKPGHSWNSLLFEKFRMPSADRPETVIDWHVLWFWDTAGSGDYAGPTRHFFRFNNGLETNISPVARVIRGRHSSTPFELTLCALDPASIDHTVLEDEDLPTPAHARRLNIQDSIIQRLVTLLMEELRAQNPSGRLCADSLAHALAVRILHLENGFPDRRLDSRISALPLPALRRVLNRIEESFRTELSLASLAGETGYSRGHFVKMFRKAMGITPHHYVLKRRVEHARFLLKRKHPKVRIIDVAALCGFSSQAHLTQVFRQFVGITPGDYRRQL